MTNWPVSTLLDFSIMPNIQSFSKIHYSSFYFDLARFSKNKLAILKIPIFYYALDIYEYETKPLEYILYAGFVRTFTWVGIIHGYMGNEQQSN